MKRRRRGTGTIDMMRDGTFRPRLPGNGGRLRAYASYEEAERALDVALLDIAEGAAAPVGGVTLTAFGQEILDHRERSGVRSVGTDRSRWRMHIEPAYFGAWPLKAIRRADVIAWRDWMLAKKAAPSGGQKKKRRPKPLSKITIQNTLNLLRVVFSAAQERGLIEENPAKDVKLPRSAGRTHEPWTYLLPQEQSAILSCADIPEADRLLIAFAMGTGMRQGEVWNLELADVDRVGWKVTVRYGSRGKATKSGKIRRVPLFGMARDAVEQWLSILPEQKNPHRLLWPLPSGARRQKGKAPSGWNEFLAAAKIVREKRHDGQPVRWHDLRHTCASSLVAGWWGRRWSLEEVKRLLGHSSITVTERYAHLAESALDAAARDTDSPTIAPQEIRPQSVSARNHGAPPARIGLATFGLGRHSDPASIQEVNPLRGVIVGLSGRALDGLRAIQVGGPDAWRVVHEVLLEIVRAGELALPETEEQTG